MHPLTYYRNKIGKTDRHAKKIEGQKYDANKIRNRKVNIINGNYNNYDTPVIDILSANTYLLDINRKNTKLALRNSSLGIIPKDKIATNIREYNYSLVPINTTLAPMRPTDIKLAA